MWIRRCWRPSPFRRRRLPTPTQVHSRTTAQVSPTLSRARAVTRGGSDLPDGIPGLGYHVPLKGGLGWADTRGVDAAERKEILDRYENHSRRFEEVASRRRSVNGAEVIPFQGPLRQLEQEPTMREIEVLQRISDGLVNREIGVRLFLSEETVKSHVRHLLAKLQARSRAHAVAVGFRRGIIG